MKVLLTEQDVLEHSYGVAKSNTPEIVEVQEPESDQSDPPVTQPSAGAESEASTEATDLGEETESSESPSSEPVEDAQTLETLVSSLKDQYSAKELQNKAQEIGLEVSGSKTDLATALAKAILASKS